ncbi:MAG: acido-empty-quinoprotein group A, partial [Bryobacteraceae bacterium]
MNIRLLLAGIVLVAPLYAHQLNKSWPTYNGDYSGRRFSELSQINASNVKDLTLVWTYDSGGVPIKATPLMVGGVLYFTVPD